MMNARPTTHERDADGYCTVSQAAALLGVSRVSIWRWIRDGHLPATRLGQRITRIKREDLERTRIQIESTSSRSWVAQNQAARAEVPQRFGPPENEAEHPAPDHAVQFYETDAFLLETVAEFIGAALRAGGAGIVVATKPHRDDLAQRLCAAGFDLDQALAGGRYTAIDAAETLSRFMVDGMPDADRFVEVMGSLLARAGQGTRRVRIFGEMVTLLVTAENYAAAVQLEALWNELQRNEHFSLLCAYPIGRLGAETLRDVLGDICASHAHVIPAESFTSRPTEQERLRAVVNLQQKARWLEYQVAERAQTETELRFALALVQDNLREAIAAQRKRDELISVAVQELKHPLYSLSLQAQRALLQLGRETRLPLERVEKAVEAVSGQPIEIPRLMGQLVEFSRIETGKLTLLPRWVDLTDLVERVVADMRARSNRHTIAFAAPGRLEAWIDEERTAHVLVNLVDNAIRHNPDGGTIDIALTHSARTGATLTVWDRGPGIASGQRGALFEHDEIGHDHDPDALHVRGLGVGLFVSRQIVELHGGELYAEFPPEGGSRFVMRLPIGLGDSMAPVAAD